jgi:hypothetical protein
MGNENNFFFVFEKEKDRHEQEGRREQAGWVQL